MADARRKRFHHEMASGDSVRFVSSSNTEVEEIGSGIMQQVVDNSMEVEEIGHSPIHIIPTPKKWKLPTFSVDESIQKLHNLDKRSRLEALADLKFAFPFLSLPVPQRKDSLLQILSFIRKRVYSEQDNTVKQRIIELLAKFAQLHDISSSLIITDLLAQFKNPKGSVISSILRALQQIFTCKPPTKEMINTIETICWEQLQSHHFHVRKASISLLCRISNSNDLQESFGRTCELDPDPRVRACSFDAILILHKRNVALDIDLYRKAVEGMNDDYEEVKIKALELLWLLCNLHPLHVFTTKREEQTRLIDDGFIRICDLVNDTSMPVRVKASRLLGGLGNVSTQYLIQAFSKESFGRGTKLKLSRSKSNEVSAAGDFDLTQCADVNVLDSGAGAFVHGLEDEYYQVRMATIDSICELSCASPNFARIAVEFLVDMFNDEIDAVRVNSIQSLRKISAFIQLNEEQLQIALSALEDITPGLRRAMQKLLMKVRLSNIQSVHTSIKGLLGNLKKYPEDKEAIFQTLQGIGENHGNIVEYLAENLLTIDLNFAQMEANVNDIFYIAKLIVVCNAASQNPHILSLLPRHTARHYRFLRDKHPLYFPSAMSFSEENTLSVPVPSLPTLFEASSSSVDISTFFSTTWAHIIERYGETSSLGDADELMKSFTKNMKHISRTHSHLASSVQFYSLQHKALSLMLQAKSQKLKRETAAIAPEILRLSYQIEHTLCGFSGAEIVELQFLRLFSHSLAILSSLSHQIETEPLARGGMESLMQRIQFTNQYCEQRRIEKPQKLQELTSCATQFSNHPNDSQLTPHLLKLLECFPLSTFPVQRKLKSLKGVISSPHPNSEHPTEFNPMVPLTLRFSARVENMSNTRGLMVYCIFPNHKIQLFPIVEQHITPVSAFKVEIECTLSIDCGFVHGWSEKSSITLQLAKMFPADIPECDNAAMHSEVKDSFVAFGSPILYYLYPKKNYKPSKKGK